MNRKFEQLFLDLKAGGLPVVITELQPPTIKLDGFYKSGSVNILFYEDKDLFVFEDRYTKSPLGEETSVDVIVGKNFEEWMECIRLGWTNPNPEFLPHMKRLELIEAQTLYKPKV